MTNNLELWDKVKRPPEDALKQFKRGGGFSGTAIKPMWSIHKMTEVFGACGTAWGIGEPKFEIVPGYNSEVLVYCTVQVWLDGMGHRLTGVGGDKVVKHIPANAQYNRPERWENDDEAFKKAFTDAITNALKHLGVGADIHMGLWDGSKYADETPEEPKKQAYDRSPIVKAKFAELTTGIRERSQRGTLEDLAEYWKTNQAAIVAMPADWKALLEEEKEAAKSKLKEAA